ncbi:hypothetical protein N7G274_006453 [Stereocaulon virgatum]|uniref:P-loop containing nucleoside triphosphate hydrolase protein n=1 Tax=Stereocaulon virgatum TaxID=373712 RepID=A0ABR4A7E0_9LECA
MVSALRTLGHKDMDFSMGQPTALGNGHFETKEDLHGRAYQYEMLEESMKRNIIVAADTGSGKTLIAILRIQEELQRCSPEKFVWFCVPTVALAIQQHQAISTQISAFQARVVSGADNVDHWSTKAIWDEILKGIHIIVSTHQVLLEALEHGFVRMQRLALMVFDEAHSCIGDHPSSMILRKFYHCLDAEERPGILGLTASPVINNHVGTLERLEANLNAIVKTPKLHRNEMLQYVYRPELILLKYPANSSAVLPSLALGSLKQVFEGLIFEQDPWVIKMQSDPSMRNSRAYRKASISHKTYCRDQIKGLYNKALAVHTELGPSAADYYIHQCIQKFQRGATEGSFVVEGMEDDEKKYLRKKFAEVEIPNQEADVLRDKGLLTPKVHMLFNFIRKEDPENFSGLVFVQTRAEVAVLSHLLAVNVPNFAISTFVGASSFSGRKATIGELADVKDQRTTLDDLRQGRKNLVVTTNALEEGIDVSACNAVICFNEPPNLKSFIQRRGRARKSTSKFVLMFEDGGGSEALLKWDKLEDAMRELYMNDMRVLQEIQTLEAQGEEGSRVLSNEYTGAKLTLDDAVQHLSHFCATLPAVPYVDLRPLFIFEEEPAGPNEKMISAKVVLPNSVDASLREAHSLRQWKTEKMAKRDAAFEAYAALYKAGLVNEHLLPLGHVDEGVDEAYAAIEKRPSLTEVSEQMNPWLSVAEAWRTPSKLIGSLITFEHHESILPEMIMLLPTTLSDIAEFELYWDAVTTIKATVKPNNTEYSRAIVASAAQSTRLIFNSIFGSKMNLDQLDFTTLFLPNSVSNLSTWVKMNTSVTRADNVCQHDLEAGAGLIRDLTQNRLPYVFRDVTYASLKDIKADGSIDLEQYETSAQARLNVKASEDIPQDHGFDDSMVLDHNGDGETYVLIEMTRLPKKINFLQRVPGQDARVGRTSELRMMLAQRCEMDRLPFKYSQFAMFIPSILHKIQVAMVVDHLCSTVLFPLHFTDRGLVHIAISAPSAQESGDYNRLEFLGDSYLKFFTSLTLVAEHLNYHEGILSHQKDHIVSNGPLALAAILVGLDKFILTKAFTGAKWRPTYNHELLQDQVPKKREMSTKTLADVVEALLGASYIDGGPEKALKCLEIFIPNVPWSTASRAVDILYPVYDLKIQSSSHLSQVEQLLGYEFNLKGLLIESLTHASHISPNGSASYQRLEFLGDSILDNIVTTTAYAYEPPIATQDLHLIRTALVNGNYLGYLCLTHSISLHRTDPVTDDPKNISTMDVTYSLNLWQAMRHGSLAVRTAQQFCLARLKPLQDQISETLAHGSHYPWSLLARLEPPKFLSDTIESLLGAIYIDTHGSLPTCRAFLEHIGLMSYLRRVMDEKIALLHPKEELGRLADREKVQYVMGEEGEEGKVRLTCGVLVGEREVVRVGDGLGRMEVQTRAADVACGILKGEAKAVGGGGADRTKGEDQEEAEEEAEDGEGGGVGLVWMDLDEGRAASGVEDNDSDE